MPSALRRPALACALAALAVAPLAAAAQPQPIRLDVDLTHAVERVFHAHETLPVEPGPLTLRYPKWIPGEHGPTGPISDLAGLAFKAGGAPVAWQRDPLDMFTFHLEVPPGATSLDVDLDYLTPGGEGNFSASPATTDRIAVLSWNTVLLYPAGPPSDAIPFRPSLTLPAGWRFATALRPTGSGMPHEPGPGGRVEFEPVSLTTLVDSPVAAGVYLRAVDVSGTTGIGHELDLVADSEAALGMTPETVGHYRNLVAEALALFGAHHYRDYHFLVTMSDHLTSFGLEHHESSDDRVGERTFLDPELLVSRAGLLPHEFVHSWNAKYRRPAGLATPDYQTPMVDDLLWVYEGLTSYLGPLLTARSGLWTPEQFREELALVGAGLEPDARPGRTWRPLGDTARAAQILYGTRRGGSSWRRGVDFYDEGFLLWLEVDAVLRHETGDHRSIDDFVQLFHGGASGPPEVVPFTFDDLAAALGRVAPYDWRRFLTERVSELRPGSPLAGVIGSGWRLVYDERPNEILKAQEKARHRVDLSYSLGLSLAGEKGEDRGRIADVIAASPAAAAGVAPDMTLVAVNGRAFTPEVLRRAVADAKGGSAPIELLVENSGYYHTLAVDYHGGERYPHLERVAGTPDYLGEIIAPHAGHPGS
jgi:predicted metalloprotease with PDZ domain